MAIIAYTDPLNKERTEFVAITVDEKQIKAAAAAIRAMAEWFENTTGVLVYPERPAEAPEEPAPVEEKPKRQRKSRAKKTNGATEPATSGRKRRTPEEIEAEKERVMKGLDINDPTQPDLGDGAFDEPAAAEDHPSAEDLVAAGKSWLNNAEHTMAMLVDICKAHGAAKISELTPEGRSGVMAKLMETANG